MQFAELLVAGPLQKQVEGVKVALTGLLLNHARLLQQVVVDMTANGITCIQILYQHFSK
jgi:hypothetical protein